MNGWDKLINESLVINMINAHFIINRQKNKKQGTKTKTKTSKHFNHDIYDRRGIQLIMKK